MCKPATMLIGRTRVWWSPDHDSHERLIAEAGLSDGLRGLDAVRVEIVPPGNDYSLPLEQWEYHTDQDTVPDWYSPGEGEIAARAELPAWAAHHIVREGEVEVHNGQTRMLLGTASAVVHGGEVRCYDTASAEVHGGDVVCYGQSSAEVHGGWVRCGGQSSAEVHGGWVGCYGTASAEVHGGWVECYGTASAEVHGGRVRCYDTATMDDRR